MRYALPAEFRSSFNTIGVDDGIAMGHERNAPTRCLRELIATRWRRCARRTASTRWSASPNCDKIVPGMLMGAARANIPTIFIPRTNGGGS